MTDEPRNETLPTQSEAVKALTFEEWHNGQNTCCKDCANNCEHIGWERVAWNAGRASIEREMAALREPGPCGHPKTCWKDGPDLNAVRQDVPFGGGCTVCAEQASLESMIDERQKTIDFLDRLMGTDDKQIEFLKSQIDEARKLAKLIKQNNRAEAFQWVCDKVLAVLDRKRRWVADWKARESGWKAECAALLEKAAVLVQDEQGHDPECPWFYSPETGHVERCTCEAKELADHIRSLITIPQAAREPRDPPQPPDDNIEKRGG